MTTKDSGLATLSWGGLTISHPPPRKPRNLPDFEGNQTHSIHGTGIFTYIWLIFMVNVGI